MGKASKISVNEQSLICPECGTDEVFYEGSNSNGMIKYTCVNNHSYEVNVLDLPNVEDKEQEKLFPDAITENVVLPLTEEEKINYGNELADLQILIDKKETEKKKVSAAFKTEIDGLSAQALGIARILESGEITKPTKCYWKIDDPEQGQKSLYIVANNEFVKTVDMNLFDSQNDNNPYAIPTNGEEEE